MNSLAFGWDAMGTITDQQTVETRDVARIVEPIWRLALKSVSPIVKLNDGKPSVPIYCVHPISGDVVSLRALAEHLGTRRLYGIQVPKDKMNGRFAASIEGMARYYVGLLMAAQPDGAIILAGWSAGAVVALEMARQLRSLGRDVPLLIALDGAPCNTGAGLRPWQPSYLLQLLINLPRWIRDDTEQDWSPSGLWKRIRFKLAARFGIGPRARGGRGPRNVETMDAGIVQGLLETKGWSADQTSFIHAMYKATIDYVPEPYDGRVIVYETRTQPLYHLRQVGAAWTRIATSAEIVRLEGNHSAITREPTIGIIARHLLACLATMRDVDGERDGADVGRRDG